MSKHAMILKSAVLRQPMWCVSLARPLFAHPEQRNFATKPPFFKRGFGGNVNISYYTQMRPFSGLCCPVGVRLKGVDLQARLLRLYPLWA